MSRSQSSLAFVVDPALRVQVGAREIDPIAVEGKVHTFAIPSVRSDLHLISRSNVANEIFQGSVDARRLGIGVGRIVLRSGPHRKEIPLDHPALGAGFHEAEKQGVTMWRWTNGDAVLPAQLLDVFGEAPSSLEIHLNRELPIYRVAGSTDSFASRKNGSEADLPSEWKDEDAEEVGAAIPRHATPAFIPAPSSDPTPAAQIEERDSFFEQGRTQIVSPVEPPLSPPTDLTPPVPLSDIKEEIPVPPDHSTKPEPAKPPKSQSVRKASKPPASAPAKTPEPPSPAKGKALKTPSKPTGKTPSPKSSKSKL